MRCINTSKCKWICFLCIIIPFFCLVWYLPLHCFTHIVSSELLKSKPDAKNLPLDFTRRIVWNPKIACTICNAKKQKTLIGKNLYISHYMHHIFFMLLIRYLCCYRVNERLGSTLQELVKENGQLLKKINHVNKPDGHVFYHACLMNTLIVVQFFFICYESFMNTLAS